MIVEEKPQSYQELAEMSGRKPSNLGRTLKTLEQYRIIDIKQSAQVKRPVAIADRQNGTKLSPFSALPSSGRANLEWG